MNSDANGVEAKLDTVIRLLALDIAMGEGTLKERAIKLARAGLSSKDIAELCDTTTNTISVALSKAKAEKKTKTKETPNAKGKDT